MVWLSGYFRWCRCWSLFIQHFKKKRIEAILYCRFKVHSLPIAGLLVPCQILKNLHARSWSSIQCHLLDKQLKNSWAHSSFLKCWLILSENRQGLPQQNIIFRYEVFISSTVRSESPLFHKVINYGQPGFETKSDPSFMRVHGATAEILEILHWFVEDFTNRNMDLIKFINKYREVALTEDSSLDCYSYIWKLNDLK